jgi:hypothetical protein
VALEIATEDILDVDLQAGDESNDGFLRLYTAQSRLARLGGREHVDLVIICSTLSYP